MRQARSRAVVEALEPWLRAKLALISQTSKLAEAIRSALARSAGLSRFLDDRRIEIDSNVVERAIRPVATMRSLCTFSQVSAKIGSWFWNSVRHGAFLLFSAA